MSFRWLDINPNSSIIAFLNLWLNTEIYAMLVVKDRSFITIMCNTQFFIMMFIQTTIKQKQ